MNPDAGWGGQKLQKVGDLMHKIDAMPLVHEKAHMDQALLALTEKNLGCAVIVDQNRTLCGIITDGDLKRHMSPDLLQKPVSDIMSRKPKSISSDALAVEAMDIMTRTPGRYLTSLIVMDENGELAGLIRLQDCLQAGIA